MSHFLSATTNQLFLLLVLLNAVDALTTHILIGFGGLDVEVNPFMKAIIGEFGSYGMVAFKVFAILSLWVMTFVANERELRSIHLSLIGVCVIYGALAIHNSYGVLLVWGLI